MAQLIVAQLIVAQLIVAQLIVAQLALCKVRRRILVPSVLPFLFPRI